MKPTTPENTSAIIAKKCVAIANALAITLTPRPMNAWNRASTDWTREAIIPKMAETKFDTPPVKPEWPVVWDEEKRPPVIVSYAMMFW
jgi:hypothetical protein